MVSIVWFLNGLFATQPNNYTIFTSVFATFPSLPLLEFGLLADTQAEGEKNGKSDVRNSSTVYIFIFVPGLLTALRVPWNQTWDCNLPAPEPSLCALNAVTALYPSDATSHKAKITKSHLPPCSVNTFLDFSSALIKQRQS